MTMPRLLKTKPNLASSDARRMSMAHCMVTPTPTAGPLQAEITGFRQSKMRRVRTPPPSGPRPPRPSLSRLKVLPPPDRSAPAQ